MQIPPAPPNAYVVDIASLKYPHLHTTIGTLIHAVQMLSLAQSLDVIMQIVRDAARTLANADGATFVLLDNNLCFYAEENAISPLWKGRRFPVDSCISGWAMKHKQRVVIEDVFEDPRIPHDVYRSTFVKSLAMTPIRTADPLGAIGTYWSTAYMPTGFELDALQALADATSIALENVRVTRQLQERIVDLECINHKLERLTWLASHDLKEPLRGIQMSTQQIEICMAEGNASDIPRRIEFIKKSSDLVHRMVDDLLDISKIENYRRSVRSFDSNMILDDVMLLLQSEIEKSRAEITYKNLPTVLTDPILLSRVFQNLISNALKFHLPGRVPKVRITASDIGSKWEFQVKDNGIGISKDYFESIFDYFTRLNSKYEYPGSGVGLAICKKIIEDLGDKLSVQSKLGVGSTFIFTVDKVLG